MEELHGTIWYTIFTSSRSFIGATHLERQVCSFPGLHIPDWRMHDDMNWDEKDTTFASLQHMRTIFFS